MTRAVSEYFVHLSGTPLGPGLVCFEQMRVFYVPSIGIPILWVVWKAYEPFLGGHGLFYAWVLFIHGCYRLKVSSLTYKPYLPIFTFSNKLLDTSAVCSKPSRPMPGVIRPFVAAGPAAMHSSSQSALKCVFPAHDTAALLEQPSLLRRRAPGWRCI